MATVAQEQYLQPEDPRGLWPTDTVERLDEEFKRRIKMQTVLPFAEKAAMAHVQRPPGNPGASPGMSGTGEKGPEGLAPQR